MGADVVVGGQQHGVEVLPGVVSPGVSVLDLHDDRRGCRRGGDGEHRADLLDRARFEGHVAKALLAQALQQRRRLVELGHAGGDDDAVHRRPGSTGLGQQALGSQVQVPQVAVHEHGVEGRGASRLQLLLEAVEVGLEHRRGGLASAGQLGPVAGVRGSRHDLRVDRGRGHSRQEHGRASRQAGEGRVQREATVRQARQARSVARTVHRGRRAGSGTVQVVQVARGAGRHDPDSGACHRGRGDAGQDVARPQVHHHAGVAAVSRCRQRLAQDLGPVHGIGEHSRGQVTCQRRLQAAGCGPGHDVVDGRGQEGAVEGHRGG